MYALSRRGDWNALYIYAYWCACFRNLIFVYVHVNENILVITYKTFLEASFLTTHRSQPSIGVRVKRREIKLKNLNSPNRIFPFIFPLSQNFKFFQNWIKKHFNGKLLRNRLVRAKKRYLNYVSSIVSRWKMTIKSLLIYSFTNLYEFVNKNYLTVGVIGAHFEKLRMYWMFFLGITGKCCLRAFYCTVCHWNCDVFGYKISRNNGNEERELPSLCWQILKTCR